MVDPIRDEPFSLTEDSATERDRAVQFESDLEDSGASVIITAD